ncbi:MAG: ABC transporter ATP-binding protein, partial [Candidatus Syntropharchaeales archaeon]
TRKRGILAIMAIHDLNLASRYADRVAMMHGGKIAAVGTPEDVLTVENIRSVYGVEVAVRNDGGKPYILPIRPVEV